MFSDKGYAISGYPDEGTESNSNKFIAIHSAILDKKSAAFLLLCY